MYSLPLTSQTWPARPSAMIDLVRDVAEAAAGQHAPCGLDQLALRPRRASVGACRVLSSSGCSTNATARVLQGATRIGSRSRIRVRARRPTLPASARSSAPIRAPRQTRRSGASSICQRWTPMWATSVTAACPVLNARGCRSIGDALGQRVAHAAGRSRAAACARGSGRRSTPGRRTAAPAAASMPSAGAGCLQASHWSGPGPDEGDVASLDAPRRDRAARRRRPTAPHRRRAARRPLRAVTVASPASRTSLHDHAGIARAAAIAAGARRRHRGPRRTGCRSQPRKRSPAGS